MTEPHGIRVARALLTDAVGEMRLCSAAVAEVGSSAGPLWREPFGRLAFTEDSAVADEHTIFDLASLTKPIATTQTLLALVAQGRVALDEPVSGAFVEWRGEDRSGVTVQDLLEHASGLPARLVDSPPRGRREFEHDICLLPLEYEPRTRSLYSDLGFILLGFLIADRGRAALDAQFAALLEASIPEHDRGFLGFRVPADHKRRTAVTAPLPDDFRRGRTFAGEVHDDYAAALDGVAGHAGLFGTAPSVGSLARLVLRAARGDATLPEPFTPARVALTIRRSRVPGSSRGLGWDTMLPTSSCGSLMSHTAFGHTGFTGTSLWIDPVRDRYYVLLTNRAAGAGTLKEMADVRRAFHEGLAAV